MPINVPKYKASRTDCTVLIKLYEEQVETKRPKSPGRQDEKQEEQHVDSVYDTNLKLLKKIKEMMDKGFAGPSAQHKGDGSKRE